MRAEQAPGTWRCVTLRDERRIEEAPEAYKPIGPVIDAQEQAGLIRSAVRLKPWVYVQGMTGGRGVRRPAAAAACAGAGDTSSAFPGRGFCPGMGTGKRPGEPTNPRDNNSPHTRARPVSIMAATSIKRNRGAMLHFGWKVSVAGAIMFALSGCTNLVGVLYCDNSQVNFPDYHCFQPY